MEPLNEQYDHANPPAGQDEPGSPEDKLRSAEPSARALPDATPASPSAVATAADLAAMQDAPAARKSCVECVEKHLGAAWVLVDEWLDGYPHRLLAIGHLHEAEDESRLWPPLHEAIRTARKRFQHDGTIPDFPALADRVEAI
jgi:hypothetical protein